MKFSDLKPQYYVLIALALSALYLYWSNQMTDQIKYVLALLAVAALMALGMIKDVITLDRAEMISLGESERRRGELRWTPTGDLVGIGGKLQYLDNGHSIDPWRYVCGVKMLSTPEREFICMVTAYGSVTAFDEIEKGFCIDDWGDVITHKGDRGNEQSENMGKVPDQPNK